VNLKFHFNKKMSSKNTRFCRVALTQETSFLQEANNNNRYFRLNKLFSRSIYQKVFSQEEDLTKSSWQGDGGGRHADILNFQNQLAKVYNDHHIFC
jgi:hypothetical protein